jgi:hypothetical protein
MPLESVQFVHKYKSFVREQTLNTHALDTYNRCLS